jgi:hypothetical protein
MNSVVLRNDPYAVLECERAFRPGGFYLLVLTTARGRRRTIEARVWHSHRLASVPPRHSIAVELWGLREADRREVFAAAAAGELRVTGSPANLSALQRRPSRATRLEA